MMRCYKLSHWHWHSMHCLTLLWQLLLLKVPSSLQPNSSSNSTISCCVLHTVAVTTGHAYCESPYFVSNVSIHTLFICVGGNAVNLGYHHYSILVTNVCARPHLWRHTLGWRLADGVNWNRRLSHHVVTCYVTSHTMSFGHFWCQQSTGHCCVTQRLPSSVSSGCHGGGIKSCAFCNRNSCDSGID